MPKTRLLKQTAGEPVGFVTKINDIQSFDLEVCDGCNQRDVEGLVISLNEKWSLLELYALLLEIF